MTIEKLKEIMELYGDQVVHAAMYCLKDEQRAQNVTYYTFCNVMDHDVTEESVILEIAKCELLNELHNLALTWKPKRKLMSLSKKLLSLLGLSFVAAVGITCLVCWLVSLLIGK